jgi:hypothetical protein
MKRIYRIQDADGRGPYKPGFSHVWCDSFGLPPPRTWMEEFPGLHKRMNEDMHYGAGGNSIEQVRKWFTPTEYCRLLILGYRLVSMEVDHVMAESRNQLVFKRAKPLKEDIEFHDLYTTERTSSGSAPSIHDVSGFADEHGNRPLSGHGSVSDQRTTRAATDALFGDA